MKNEEKTMNKDQKPEQSSELNSNDLLAKALFDLRTRFNSLRKFSYDNRNDQSRIVDRKVLARVDKLLKG